MLVTRLDFSESSYVLPSDRSERKAQLFSVMFALVPSPSAYPHLRWLVLPRNKWNSFSPEENSEPTPNFRFPVGQHITSVVVSKKFC